MHLPGRCGAYAYAGAGGGGAARVRTRRRSPGQGIREEAEAEAGEAAGQKQEQGLAGARGAAVRRSGGLAGLASRLGAAFTAHAAGGDEEEGKQRGEVCVC